MAIAQTTTEDPRLSNHISLIHGLTNTLRLRQNGPHFADNIFNAFSFELWIKFHWNLFLWVQLTIIKHCFRWWLGTEQAASHYLNQWWHSLVMHLCLNELRIYIHHYSDCIRISITFNSISPWTKWLPFQTIFSDWNFTEGSNWQ